jgi:hypothetical protein
VTIGTFEKGAMLVEVRVSAGSAMLPWTNIKLPNTVKLPSTSTKSGPVDGFTNMNVMGVGLMVYGVVIRADLTVPFNAMSE